MQKKLCRCSNNDTENTKWKKVYSTEIVCGLGIRTLNEGKSLNITHWSF